MQRLRWMGMAGRGVLAIGLSLACGSFLVSTWNRWEPDRALAQSPAQTSLTPDPTRPQTMPLLSRHFVVFDGFIQKGKPDTARYWMKPLASQDRTFWPPTRSPDEKPNMDEPDERSTRLTARNMARQKTQLIYLDIEHWDVSKDDSASLANRQKLARVMDWMHEEVPGLRLGYYGVLPIRDYWNATKPETSPEYQNWQAANRRLIPLAKHVDVVMPSLYTFYDDPAGWKRYAIANLKEAKIYNRPVYAFLWPQYHESDPKLSGQWIASDYWRMQLETCYQYADGVIIWGWWPNTDWNPKAPWWVETVKFMKEKGICPPDVRE